MTAFAFSGNDDRRIRLLGVEVDCLTLSELQAIVRRAIDTNRQVVVGNHNLNSVYWFHRDPDMRRFYRDADYIHIDGMGIVAAGRLLGLPCEARHRITYLDWIPKLAELGNQRDLRFFFLGARRGLAERAAARLSVDFPRIQFFTHHGYFDTTPGSESNDTVVAKIQEFCPHLLFVGMGMPRQEEWIVDNRNHLPPCVILDCGALFDYLAGSVKSPPRWLGKIGLEWLYRLFTEPKRLWRRYLVYPFRLLPLLASELKRRYLRR